MSPGDYTDQERRTIGASLLVNASILGHHGLQDECMKLLSLRLKVLGELVFEDVTP